MSVYLRDNPPARSQYRSPRRARLTGAIVVHVTDGRADLIGADTGAENTASWIVRRPDPGSYHDLVDSDSIIQLVDYDDEAYHDGTGGNRWSLGLSAACKPDDWRTMPPATRAKFVDNLARAAARQALHVHTRTGIVVPAGRITAAQYRAGAAGFVTHAELDPGRRTDPGEAFPWKDLLATFAHYRDIALGHTAPPAPQPEGPLMALTDAEQTELLTKVREIHSETVESRDNKAGKKASMRWLVAKIAKGEKVT